MTELRKVGEKGAPDAFSYGVELIKDTTGDTYNINAFVDDLNVWESLFAKSMQAALLITDGAGLIEQIALQPGDQVHIVLFKGEDAEKKIDKTFEILSIGAGAQTENRQGRAYKLSCVTSPAIYNKISVVNKALSGKLSDMAKEIASTYLKIAELDVEESDGDKKNVVMPGRKPFVMLNWLANHAVSVEGGIDNSFYLFYEDRDGFHFQTVRRIISLATTHEYSMTSDSSRTKDKDDVFRIIEWQQNKIGNNATRLDGGMYENELMEFNLLGRQITSQRFNFKDQAQNLQLLGANPVVDLANNFDRFVQDVGKVKGAIAALRIRSNEEAYGEVNTYGRKHSAMLAQKQMFNQLSYSFAVGGNAALKAGDLIDVVAMGLDAKEQKEFDAMLNGKFLIGNVRHRVVATKSYITTVDVFKDGFDGEWTPKDNKGKSNA